MVSARDAFIETERVLLRGDPEQEMRGAAPPATGPRRVARTRSGCVPRSRVFGGGASRQAAPTRRGEKGYPARDGPLRKLGREAVPPGSVQGPATATCSRLEQPPGTASSKSTRPAAGRGWGYAVGQLSLRPHPEAGAGERYARAAAGPYLSLGMRVDAHPKDELEISGIFGSEELYICYPSPRPQGTTTPSSASTWIGSSSRAAGSPRTWRALACETSPP